MTKQMHPADAADRAKIANATHFNVHLRKGPADKINQEAPTLAEAVKIADALKVESRKPAMIYAIMPEGTTVFVPQDMADAAREGDAPAEPEPGLSNTQIAQLTAMITGGGFKRANSKEAAIARFTTVASEKSIDAAAVLSAGDFERAKTILGNLLAAKAGPMDAISIARTAHDDETIDIDHMSAAEYQSFTAKPEAAQKRREPGKRAAALEAAQRGELPAPPDFSAATHKPHRKKLEAVAAMVKAGDIEGLKAIEIKPISSSPKAIAKYRDLAVIALNARSTPA